MANLALNFPAGGGSSSGHSPIWPAGRVVYNGRADLVGQNNRIHNTKRNQSAIGGGTTPEIWMMQRHRIAVTERTPQRKGDGTDTRQDIDIYLTDCANGFGKKGETMDQLNERIGGIFVTAGQILTEGQREAIAAQKAGLQTIPNTGPYNIHMHEWVLVSAPDPTAPQPAPPRDDVPVDKILWWTTPFSHLDSIGSVANAHKMLTARPHDAVSESVAREYRKLYPAAAQFVTGIGRGVETLALVGIVAALEAGIVRYTPHSEWKTQAEQFASIPKEERARTLQEIGREILTTDDNGNKLNLRDRPSDTQYEPLMLTDKEDPTKQVTFLTYLMDSAFARREGYRWFKADRRTTRSGQPAFSDPAAEVMVVRQQQAIAELVATIRHADMNAKRRILGIAMSPARPGQSFDILLCSTA